MGDVAALRDRGSGDGQFGLRRRPPSCAAPPCGGRREHYAQPGGVRRKFAGRRSTQVYWHQPDRAQKPVVRGLHGHGARRTGHPGGGNLALGYEHYGTRVSGPQVGAIAVMGRHGGGHVGVVTGVDPSGNPIIVSGNHNNTVAEVGLSALADCRLCGAERRLIVRHRLLETASGAWQPSAVFLLRGAQCR